MDRVMMYAGENPGNWLECTCGNRGPAELVCEGTDDSRKHGTWDLENDGHYSVITYKVLLCQACWKVSILRYTQHGDTHDDFSEPDEPEVVYYLRDTVLSPPKERHHAVPTAIADVLTQAQAVNVASPRASFILCRAALEEICRDKGIPETETTAKGKVVFLTLNRKLELLVEQEQLPTGLKEIVHGVRDLGNEGAHGAHRAFTRKVDREDADTLLTLVDYVIERIYVDPERAQEAAQRLENLRRKVLRKADKNSPKKEVP